MATRISTSKKIVNEILDKGLAQSTWAETFPDAFEQLKKYRKDMKVGTRDILIRDRKQLIKSFEDI